jgi:hypothetical protein
MLCEVRDVPNDTGTGILQISSVLLFNLDANHSPYDLCFKVAARMNITWGEENQILLH